MKLSDRIKQSVSLVEVAGRNVTWDATLSSPRTGDWWAPCPFHAEKSASFHVREKPGSRGVFYCHGCGEKGSVIDFVEARDRAGFTAAVRWLAQFGRLEDDDAEAAAARARAEEERTRRAHAETLRIARRNLDSALKIWRASIPDHPDVRAYLEGRGIDLGAIGGVPRSLRWHPGLSVRDNQGNVVHHGPAMVGFVGRRAFYGVHRTWIDGPARARLADGTKVPKAWLGTSGEMKGQPVQLTATGGDVLLVGEGIETTLAALGAYRRAGIRASGEAALSLGALTGPGDMSETRPDGPDGKPLPPATPFLAADKPGWLPPAAAPRVLALMDPTPKSPEAGPRLAARTVAKIAHHHPPGADWRVPRDRWDHGEDFCDLEAKGEFFA